MVREPLIELCISTVAVGAVSRSARSALYYRGFCAPPWRYGTESDLEEEWFVIDRKDRE